MFNEQAISAVAQILSGKKQSIAVAESVTSGLIQAALSSGEYASQFFEGGITAYNIRQKFRLFHVDLADASATNCVSAAVAEKMALEVERLFASDWGVGITGYAFPMPGHESGQLYAWYAISYHGSCIDCNIMRLDPSSPLEIQLQFTNTVLAILSDQVKKLQESI